MYYYGCPDCKKKVLEENVGYRCENCNKVHGNANLNYTYTAKVSDFTGSIFVSFVGEIGESILEMNSSEFKSFKENHSLEEVKDYL
jgi:replication factor A1